MSEVIRVTGLTELQLTYKALPDKLKRGMITRGVAAMAKILVKNTRLAAPLGGPYKKRGKSPGTLKRSIVRVRARELQTVTQVGQLVTALKGRKYQSTGKKGRNLDAFYAEWVDKGHRVVARSTVFIAGRANRKKQKRGRTTVRARRTLSTQKVAGVGFFAAALEKSFGPAVNAMADVMRSELSKDKI